MPLVPLRRAPRRRPPGRLRRRLLRGLGQLLARGRPRGGRARALACHSRLRLPAPRPGLARSAAAIEILGSLGRLVAERSQVPVSLLLNEARTLAHGLRGIEAGFNAVMLATSEAETIAALAADRPRSATSRSKASSARCPTANPEGEIDESHASLTDPERAAAFVAATRVDALAVSIGNVHTLEASRRRGRSRPARRDRAAPSRCRSSSTAARASPPGAVPGAIARGVAKFNVGTTLKRAVPRGTERSCRRRARRGEPP